MFGTTVQWNLTDSLHTNERFTIHFNLSNPTNVSYPNECPFKVLNFQINKQHVIGQNIIMILPPSPQRLHEIEAAGYIVKHYCLIHLFDSNKKLLYTYLSRLNGFSNRVEVM